MSQPDAVKKKTYLMDVVAIRLILIVLLIVYHALCIYTGSWELPDGVVPEIKFYDRLGMLLHNGRMQAMVFISGMLFGYNSMRRPVTGSLRPSIAKKAKRILLPCFIFGAIYYALFFDLGAPWYSIVYSILKGSGHLWFLPMLFWCYVISYILTAKVPSASAKTIFLIALLCAVFNPIAELPFQLSTVCLYYIYFMLGYSIKQNRIKLPDANKHNMLLAVITFCVSFMIFMYLRDNWNPDVKILKLSKGFVNNALSLGTSLPAIYIIYSLANRPKVTAWLKNKNFLITLSGYCYGIYVYHQFVLRWLYERTSLPTAVDAYALPWVAFLITLVSSLILCHFTLKTKFGRFLIG